jgi:hypothetical protein
MMVMVLVLVFQLLLSICHLAKDCCALMAKCLCQSIHSRPSLAKLLQQYHDGLDTPTHHLLVGMPRGRAGVT